MLPNFFIIGAAKAATTSLHAYLGEHPEIHMSPVKEPNFFALPSRGRPFVQGRIAGRDEYEALFATDAPLRGEASPSYSMHAWRVGVPERIHALVPDARFVYIVRDPVERALAHYLQTVGAGREQRSPEEALADAAEPDHPYACASMYATQLELYLPWFDLDRVVVVDQADLRADPAATMSEVYRFLGADPSFEAAGLDIEHNAAATKQRRSRALLALRSAPGRGALDRLPAAIREPVTTTARRVLSKPLVRPAITSDLRDRLEHLFAPEAERLRGLTGKRFATWSV